MMIWGYRIPCGDGEFEIDSGIFGPEAGPRLCFDREQLEALGACGILDAVRWFLDNSDEFTFAATASAFDYDEQFVSDADLERILQSGVATEELKQEARVAQQKRYDLRRHPPQAQPRAARCRAGSVYVLAAQDGSGLYKIGLSTRPSRRVPEFSPKLPFETRLIACIATEDAISLEQALHTRFQEHRVRGEWFRLGEPDIAAIRAEYGLEEAA